MRTVREVLADGRKWRHWTYRQAPGSFYETIRDMRGLFTSLKARLDQNPNFSLDDAEAFLRKPGQARRLDVIVARVDGGDTEQVLAEVLGLLEETTDVKPRGPR